MRGFSVFFYNDQWFSLFLFLLLIIVFLFFTILILISHPDPDPDLHDLDLLIFDEKLECSSQARKKNMFFVLDQNDNF